MAEGDPGWLEAHAEMLPSIMAIHDELLAVHEEKSATYGTDEDRLANFTVTAESLGMDWEAVPIIRMFEKLVRAANMLENGQAADIEEYTDIASLALCAEALRRRR